MCDYNELTESVLFLIFHESCQLEPGKLFDESAALEEFLPGSSAINDP